MQAPREVKTKNSTRRIDSRWKSYFDATKKPPEMPEIECYPILASYLNELGNAQMTSNGISAISFTEFKAWSELTGIRLTSWEVSTLRELSQSYAIGYMSGRDVNALAFWVNKKPDQKALKQGLRGLLSNVSPKAKR